MGEARRQAWAFLRHQPAFCAAIITVTALGVGSCTAVFGMMGAVLWKPWPYAAPERLMFIWHTQARAAGVIGLSPSDYAMYRDTAPAFESVAAIATRGYNLGASDGPMRVTCGRATPSLLPMLGVATAHGRWLTPEDDERAARVVVLGHDLWRTRFGADEAIVGRSILLDAIPHLVIGILPAALGFPPPGTPVVGAAACWVPTSFTPREIAVPSFEFVVIGRVKPAVSLARAQADADAVAKRIWDAYPAAVQSQVELRARVVPLAAQAIEGSGAPLALFAAAAVLQLLVGCANVSNLVLTRLHVRQREMDVRAALGATRGDLVRQLLAEALLLAVPGGLAGALLAQGLLTMTLGLGPGLSASLGPARLDPSALAFALATAAVAGMLGGILPALRARTAGTAAGALCGARTPSAGGRLDRVRPFLVVVQVAIAAAVLTVAVLLVRSVQEVARVPVGFASTGVLTFAVALPASQYADPAGVASFARGVVEELRSLPGVVSAAAASALPIGKPEPAVVAAADAGGAVGVYRPTAVGIVTSEYHAAFAIPLTRGRLFAPSDDADGPPVVLLSDSLAQRLWPAGDAVGQSLLRAGDRRRWTVVGVVGDVRQAGPDRAPVPTFYVPLAQEPRSVAALHFALRSFGPAVPAADLRRIVAERDPSLPVFALRPADDLIAASIAPRRVPMYIASVVAAIAGGVAMLGVYALTTCAAAQSAKELGIRMAVGANTADVVRRVAGRSVGLVIVGLLVSGVVSAGLSRLVASLLFEVQPYDGRTLVSVAVMIVLASGAAAMVPAWRASRIDVAAALREE